MTKRTQRAPFVPVTGPTWPDGKRRSQFNAFDGEHYVPRLSWTAGATYDKTRITTAKEMVEGQAHELPNAPSQKGSLSRGFVPLGVRLGAVGRRKMKERQSAAEVLEQRITDVQQAIEKYSGRYERARCAIAKGAYADEVRRLNAEMPGLVAQRAPETVAAMERERGLA